jgi:hypothetical protein
VEEAAAAADEEGVRREGEEDEAEAAYVPV